MIIRELMTKLGFSADTEPLAKVEQALAGIKNRLEFLAGAEIAKKLFEVSESFSEWGRNLAISADTIGITTDELQKLQFAAEKNGVSAEEMGHSMAHLARHLYEAQQGSKEATATFAKAGFTTEQIQGFKTTEDALLALSGKLSAMPNHIQRVAVAQELLGRGGFKLAHMLGQGPGVLKAEGEELRKLGLILSGPQIAALENTASAFQRLHSLLHAFGAQIASMIGPVFASMIDDMIRFYNANRALIDVNIHDWMLGLAKALGFLEGTLIGLVHILIAVAERFHMESHILKFGAHLVGLVSGAWLAIKALQILGGVFGTLISPITGAISMIAEFVGAEGLGAVLVTAGLVVAALAGIGLAIQSVFAVNKGEKSWFGQIAESVANFSDTALDPLLKKFRGKGKELGDMIAKAISDTDWSAVGNDILVGLGAVFEAAKVPFLIGAQIAAGILEGLMGGMRKASPRLMEFFFPAEASKQTEDDKEEIRNRFPGVFDKEKGGAGAEIGTNPLGGGNSQLMDILLGMAKGALGFGPPTPAAAAAGGGGTTVNMHATINVPAGTPPGAVTDGVHRAVKDVHAEADAEARRATGRDFAPVRTN